MMLLSKKPCSYIEETGNKFLIPVLVLIHTIMLLCIVSVVRLSTLSSNRRGGYFMLSMVVLSHLTKRNPMKPLQHFFFFLLCVLLLPYAAQAQSSVPSGAIFWLKAD